MSENLDNKDWRELSEAASREKDPDKLLELVRALNRVLERRERAEKNPNLVPPIQETIQVRRQELAA